jgi:LysR family transcriptional regulator, hydrogen peroxide-inducible genes activator
MERPTLQQLQYLVALEQHRHFGRAAEACNVSQPGLSSQIRELERRLGAPLFERASRQVFLTGAGAEAVERARIILRDVDDLVAGCRSARGLLTGRLRLGVIPTIAPYLLTRILPVLRDEFPGLSVHLREERTDALVSSLHGGRIDLVLLALPLEDSRLTTAELGEDPFLLALASDSPLAGTDPVDPDFLLGQPVLLLEDGHCLRGQALAICQLAGAATADDVRATSLPTLVQMVAGGVGITLLPRMAANVEAGAGSGIVTRRFREPVPSRVIGLAWRTSSPHDASYRHLAEVIAPICGLGPVPDRPPAS